MPPGSKGKALGGYHNPERTLDLEGHLQFGAGQGTLSWSSSFQSDGNEPSETDAPHSLVVNEKLIGAPHSLAQDQCECVETNLAPHWLARGHKESVSFIDKSASNGGAVGDVGSTWGQMVVSFHWKDSSGFKGWLGWSIE